MENHYTRNLDAVMEWLADDVMWIGPIHPQYVYGKENIRNILEKEQDVLCEIAEYSYDILYGGNDICVTAGRLNPRTAANTGLVLSVIQRVTFVFALAEDHPQVIHIHVSNDWEGIDEDEVFPYRAGKEAFLYLQSKIAKNKEGSKKISIKDACHNWHLISEDEIIYISASNMRSTILTLHGSISIPLLLSQLQQKLSDNFVRIHRSYIINANYLIGIKRYTAHLCNGIKLPIPQKKYTKIKLQLLSRSGSQEFIY